MATGSSIEWTEATWNPVTGCTKISPGCKNCYAERMSMRLMAMGQPNYSNGFSVTLQPKMLDLPASWKRPRTVFVNSMSDLFHKSVPLSFIRDVFDAMRKASQHRFQILTKRSKRLAQVASKLHWAPNIWMGVSIESEDYLWRLDDLKQIDASVRFLSLEPLLGPLPTLKLDGIDWVIVGGESGPRSRPISKDWVTEIRDNCIASKVPFFFKQWGGWNKKKAGRALEGRAWDEMPTPVSRTDCLDHEDARQQRIAV